MNIVIDRDALRNFNIICKIIISRRDDIAFFSWIWHIAYIEVAFSIDISIFNHINWIPTVLSSWSYRIFANVWFEQVWSFRKQHNMRTAVSIFNSVVCDILRIIAVVSEEVIGDFHIVATCAVNHCLFKNWFWHIHADMRTFIKAVCEIYASTCAKSNVIFRFWNTFPSRVVRYNNFAFHCHNVVLIYATARSIRCVICDIHAVALQNTA